MSEATPRVTITHASGYQFLVDFGGALPALATDEPPPIGEGQGPSPEQLLLAGVTNCLCASLFFALGKFRQEASGIRAEASAKIGRNEKGRLRMQAIEVVITIGAETYDRPQVERALAQFEDFCTVTESVKAGIPVAVTVSDRNGTTLASHGSSSREEPHD